MHSYYSNIYWHFTGSPKLINWGNIFCPSDILKSGKPKSDSESLKILDSIISSRKLLAKSREKIDKYLESNEFCCVTDIPLQNLSEHKKYYGNIAIGFNHQIIHKQFNPVFYISKTSLPWRVRQFDEIPESEKSYKAIFKRGSIFRPKKEGYFSRLRYGIRVDEKKIGEFSFHNFKITNYSADPSKTFYREREWRKLGDFSFDIKDIAAIIVPQKVLKKCEKILKDKNVTNISILTWELLAKA